MRALPSIVPGALLLGLVYLLVEDVGKPACKKHERELVLKNQLEDYKAHGTGGEKAPGRDEAMLKEMVMGLGKKRSRKCENVE
jgi:hypothetical protein